MYDDYDYPEYGYSHDYEAFRESTGHITDFAPAEVPKYEAAIKECGDPMITIGDGYNKGQKGLYLHRDGCLSDFWAIFRKHEGNPDPVSWRTEKVKQQRKARLEQYLYGVKGKA